MLILRVAARQSDWCSHAILSAPDEPSKGQYFCRPRGVTLKSSPEPTMLEPWLLWERMGFRARDDRALPRRWCWCCSRRAEESQSRIRRTTLGQAGRKPLEATRTRAVAGEAAQREAGPRDLRHRAVVAREALVPDARA